MRVVIVDHIHDGESLEDIKHCFASQSQLRHVGNRQCCCSSRRSANIPRLLAIVMELQNTPLLEMILQSHFRLNTIGYLTTYKKLCVNSILRYLRSIILRARKSLSNQHVYPIPILFFCGNMIHTYLYPTLLLFFRSSCTDCPTSHQSMQIPIFLLYNISASYPRQRNLYHSLCNVLNQPCHDSPSVFIHPVLLSQICKIIMLFLIPK